MKKIAKFVTISISVLGFVVFAANTPKKILSFNEIMTKTEQNRTGVSKLSTNERVALEEWLTNFVIGIAARKTNIYLGVGQEHWVTETIGSGAFIRLEDDSLWEISPIDRINTMLWLPIDYVIVIKNTNALYSYKLLGERDTAEARLLIATQSALHLGKHDGEAEFYNSTGGEIDDDQPTMSVIESRTDGDFEGWEGETIVKLENGQIWQQSEYHYEYYYAFMPDVLIFKSGSGYKMWVEGVKKAVGVEQLK